MMNRLLGACPFTSGTLACELVDGDTLLKYGGGNGTCTDTATALNSIITEVTGPDGRDENIECFIGSYFRDKTDCNSTRSTLNGAVAKFASGLFADCTITTPTTSQTTNNKQDHIQDHLSYYIEDDHTNHHTYDQPDNKQDHHLDHVSNDLAHYKPHH